jgi:tetratricopeptide (TPR) repeat protein
MAVSSVALPLITNYPLAFRACIVNSARHILTRARQAGAVSTPNARSQALHTLSYALKLPEAWPDTRELLLTLAPKMEQAGFRDEWMPYLEQGIDQSQRLGDTAVEAELRLQLGTLYRLRGKYGQARIELEASIRGFAALDVSLDQARALNALAHVARLQREFEKATSLVEAACNLLGERESERGYSYLILALVAQDKRAWPEAADYCKRALSLWTPEDNRRMIARTLTILGAAYHRLEAYAEAIAVYEQALALFEDIQDVIYQAVARMNLGNVYLALAQALPALERYRPAERTFRQIQDQHHLAMARHNIGMAYCQLGHWEQAERAYVSSLELKQEIGNVASIANTMGELGLVYLAQARRTDAKSILDAALARLADIEDEPGYAYLFETLTTQLQKASRPA